MPAKMPAKFGQAILEFALVLPILIVIILGTLDLGRVVYINTVLSNAAREGVRVGIVPLKLDSDIQNAVKNTAIGVPLQNSDITITRNTGARTISVQVRFLVTPITPFIGAFLGPSGNLNLSGQATMTTE